MTEPDVDEALSLLSEWMPRQRWYATKGHETRLRLVDAWDLPSPDDAAHVRVLLIADGATLYQVPLVVRETADPAHTIGAMRDGRVLVDGPHDPAYTAALSSEIGLGTTIRPSHVLTGEQSNTSVVFPALSDAPAVICKVFRQVHPGLNPDIELQTALAADGCRFVPSVVGQVEGAWTDEGTAHTGSLAFAQEFLPDVEDAWRFALRAAAARDDFSGPARDLGHATAAVHADLARLFGTKPVGDAERIAVADAWEQRLRLATAEVGELARHAGRIRDVYAAAMDAVWPEHQRVHGDYHLGQVIRVPGRGWVLLDFEGEPLRPIAERRLLDSLVRDVAGMLRSFDYVSGASARGDDDGTAPWARRAREAFLDGYGAVDTALLAAFELDKAVYEAMYESRNRPDWIGIPLAAIDRLAG